MYKNPEEKKAYDAAYYVANAGSINARKAVWYATNSEKINARDAAHRAANLEEERAREKVYYATNAEREKARQAAWRKANPEKKRERERMSNYGLSPEAFNLMLLMQKNACGVCKEPFLERTPQVDHCHKTGEVRGLLCSRCNKGLGHFRDSSDFLKGALEYLSHSR